MSYSSIVGRRLLKVRVSIRVDLRIAANDAWPRISGNRGTGRYRFIGYDQHHAVLRQRSEHQYV